jgi:hypothetical protein
MAANDSEDISDRTFRFACDVYDFCHDLLRLPGLPRRQYLLQESEQLISILTTVVKRLQTGPS